MSDNALGFVVDGLQRLVSSPEFRAKRAGIEAEVRAENAGRLAGATSYWWRVEREIRIRREIRRRVARIMPSRHALWLAPIAGGPRQAGCGCGLERKC